MCFSFERRSNPSFPFVAALKYAGPRASLALRSGGRAASASREPPRQQHSRGGSGGDGIRAARERGLDDPNVPSIANRRLGTGARYLQVMRISMPGALVAEPERVLRIQNEILEKLVAIPAVRSARRVSEMPMEGFDSDWGCIAGGRLLLLELSGSTPTWT
jgi:hypothetical protein